MNDIINQRSRLFSGKFTKLVLLHYDANNTIDITNIVREIKGINYTIGNFANCEMILHDKEKRINNIAYFNNGNKISIIINTMDENTISFDGYVKEFHPIDQENDLYSLKLWSVLGRCNLKYFRKGFPGINKISQILEDTFNDEILFDEEISRLTYRNIEETQTTLENFIVPLWNIKTLLDKITPYASNNNQIFMWMEDIRGLRFVNRKTLLEENENNYRPTFKFTQHQITVEQNTTETLEIVAKNKVPFNIIYDYDVEGFDGQKHKNNRDFGGTATQFNYNTKDISSYEFSVENRFKDLNTLNRYSILGNDYMNKINSIVTEYNSFPELINNYWNYNTINNLMTDYSITIRTNCIPFLNLGDIVKLEFPGIVGNVEALSGNWMVGKLRHRMEISEGNTKQERLSSYITLIRDSINIDKDAANILTLLKKDKLVIK